MFLKARHESFMASRQRGSMLVMALFVIIVLSLLGLAIVQILSDSNRSIVYEVYGARAFNAANSGAERALNEVLGPAVTAQCSNATTGPYNMPDIAAFHGCNVSINCQEFSISETGYTHFRITSSANCQAGDFVTQRIVAVEARVRN